MLHTYIHTYIHTISGASSSMSPNLSNEPCQEQAAELGRSGQRLLEEGDEGVHLLYQTVLCHEIQTKKLYECSSTSIYNRTLGYSNNIHTQFALPQSDDKSPYCDYSNGENNRAFPNILISIAINRIGRRRW